MATPTSCGIPVELTAIDTQNNNINISCKVGTNGTDNNAYGVRFYITCDGTNPSATNFLYSLNVLGTAGAQISAKIPFSKLSQLTAEGAFGNDYQSVVKIAAITCGYAGEQFYSNLSDTIEIHFIWHTRVTTPEFIKPSENCNNTGKLGSYKVSWEQGIPGINNSIKHYELKMFNKTTNELVNTFTTSNLYYNISSSAFILNNIYYFSLKAIGDFEGFNGYEKVSKDLTINTISRLPSPKLSLSEGLTVPTVKLNQSNYYVDIGSGDITKIFWETPVATGNKVDSYTVTISYSRDDTGTYYSLLKSLNIGNTTEFCISSELISKATFSKKCTLNVNIIANSYYGSSYNSKIATLTLNITRGCGIYTKVSNGYSNPIMKRAIAFAKAATERTYQALTDKDGNPLLDSTGIPLLVETADLTDEVNWTLMKEFYLKDSQGYWQLSNIQYEVLTDINGEIITDTYGKPIYLL